MSEEEKTYKERLGELVRVIETVQKGAYFDGPATMQEKLTALLTLARELRDAPMPDYNPTTGAGVEEMGAAAQAFTDLTHEQQTVCNMETDCGKHPPAEDTGVRHVRVARPKGE